MGLESYHTHEHLFYLFRLCCLCLTSPSPQHPHVSLGSVNTAGFRSRLTDVIPPCQSYLSGVPDSLFFSSTKATLDKFALLSASFEQSAFSAEDDLWTYVDTFGRSDKTLFVSYKSAVAGPSSLSVRVEKGGASSIPDESAVKLPIDSKLEKWRGVPPGRLFLL